MFAIYTVDRSPNDHISIKLEFLTDSFAVHGGTISIIVQSRERTLYEEEPGAGMLTVPHSKANIFKTLSLPFFENETLISLVISSDKHGAA